MSETAWRVYGFATFGAFGWGLYAQWPMAAVHLLAMISVIAIATASIMRLIRETKASP